MTVYRGKITSLGDYTELTTTIVHTDGFGQAKVGMFDQQKERFIDGMTIGGKTFGRLSCPGNLYPYLEIGKETEIHTWVHPFLGIPPIRTGILGVVYPEEKRAYILGLTQTALSLLLLGLLPMLWFIPGLLVGAVLGGVLHLPESIVGLIVLLVTFSPWIAGAWMIWTMFRLRSAHPLAKTPSLRG